MSDIAVKSSGKDHIEGLAIPFSVDIDGESFSAETDFCLDWYGPSGRPVLYDHGLDKAMKTNVIGRQVEYETREEGIWARSQLDAAARYRKTIDSLVEQGALAYSSGSIPHLATPRGGAIKRWPWIELSLTALPANPDARVYAVKAVTAVEHLRDANIDIPAALVADAFKALDDFHGDPPAGEPFAAHADRLLVEVKALTDRAQSIADMRAKSGRALSAANRARLSALIDAGELTLAELRAFLAETDPEAQKALTDVVWEALRTQARLVGAPI